MKRIPLIFMLLVSLLAFSHANAGFEFDNPGMAFGVSLGGAIGDNSSADDWVLQYRAHFQYKLISPVLLGQLGVGYTKLQASNVYSAELLIMENRFLMFPFSLKNLNPYLFSGVGVTKTNNLGPSSYLPMIPMGLGFQTRLGEQMLLEVSGGYNLSLSDDLDERIRSDTDLNSLTDKKNDGYFGFLVGITYAIGGQVKADQDSDGDGLSDKNEKESGMNPKKADTDNDGLNDGAEVKKYKTDPLKADSDGDGLNDGAEVNQHKTNPLIADSDGDGLNDGAEVNQYKTDPLKADSDGDGLNDGAEVNQYKTDPLKADSDDDGLSDGEEINQYKSDPLMADSDGDGLNDGVEVNQHKTDPIKADSDGDGLSDGDEINKYMTDPLKIDTDDGGAHDGAEINSKTDPLNAKDDIVNTTKTIILEKGKRVILRGVNFESNKATLTPDSKDILEIAYKALIANPEVNVEISGHTDDVGNDADNQKLSLERAQAVKNWLVKRGIPSNRMKTVGKGENEPIADNSTEQGRAENRRIEFYVE